MNLQKLYDTYVVAVQPTPSNVTNIVGSLLGCIVRLKEIHYSCNNMDIHKLSDDIISCVRGFEDRYSEISQRNGVQITVASLTVVYPQASDIEGVIQVLYSIVDSAMADEAVKNICDEFKDQLEQFEYLYTQQINK